MNIDFTAIAPIIEQLAAKLGVAAEHLWGVLVKQAYVDGISGMIWSGVWLLAAIISAVFCRLSYKNATKDGEELDLEEAAGALTGFAAFFTVAFIVIFAVVFTGGIKLLINPEYKAFMDIIRQVK